MQPITEPTPSADSALGPRSRRDRPAKTPLSRKAVVDAALDILKSHGPEAVSMRRVADALDTGAASLYVYVAGREGLLEAMLDRVTATVELEPADPGRWRLQLHAVLERLYRALVAHPGIAATILKDSPTGDAVMLLAENLLGILLAGGLSPQDAAWACDVFISLVYAAAREDDVRNIRRDRDDDQHAEQVHRSVANLPADRFPLLHAHAAQMVVGTTHERRRFAVDVVLDGLDARMRSRTCATGADVEGRSGPSR